MPKTDILHTEERKNSVLPGTKFHGIGLCRLRRHDGKCFSTVQGQRLERNRRVREDMRREGTGREGTGKEGTGKESTGVEGWAFGGKYRLTELLGEGAFSRVYLARDGQGREYACKISDNTGILAREAGYQKEIGHPLFPSFVEYGEAGGRGFLVMEYVRGETLESALRRQQFFSAEETARIGCALAAGLRHLQERSVPLLFRDLKPANVMLEEGGRVRLLDLGCVCPAGQPESSAGTPGFGAPEQFAAGSLQDVTADIYGLGRLLFTLAGGSFRGALGRVVAKCVREAPGERLPDMRTAEELLAVCCGQAGSRRFDGVQKAYLRGRITLQKNIVLRA